MMITNINTLSALFDRLITERIKHFFFHKDNLTDKVKHQEKVIKAIIAEIRKLLNKVTDLGMYNYLSEKRTFNNNIIIEQLDELIVNDIHIGESDRARLAQIQSDNPKLEVMVKSEKRLRKCNEGRGQNKNNIDEAFKKSIEGK